MEESLKNTIQDLSIAEDEMILIEKNQNGKSVNQSESTISNGSSTNKSEDKKKVENELVMQSDDEISLDSNDGQLFDKTVRISIMTSSSRHIQERNVIGGPMSNCEDDVITNSGSNIASIELDPELLTESESFDPNNRHSPIGKPASALDNKGRVLIT